MRGAPPLRRNPARHRVHAQDRRGRALRTFQMNHAQPLTNLPFVFLKRGFFPSKDGIFIRGRHLLRSSLYTFRTGARLRRIPRPYCNYVKKRPPQEPTAPLSARKTLWPAQNYFLSLREGRAARNRAKDHEKFPPRKKKLVTVTRWAVRHRTVSCGGQQKKSRGHTHPE